jgi:Leucine-rich repeat (LRR) protein
LNLKSNNITNIKSLPSAKFKNIETLDFSFNRIGDDNIKYFSLLEFKKLKLLNLYGNNFSDFKLFELCNNNKLNKLKKLYAGPNQFKNSETNITFNTVKLKEIGLINGIFTNESIHFIHNFKFDNLKRIFLYGNNLSSLSFIDKLELPNIKEIWLNDNLIDEFYPLCKYKSLKVIKVKKNKINNIDKLISFIDEFTTLRIIDISDNNIDFNDIKNEGIILEAKKKVDIIIYS